MLALASLIPALACDGARLEAARVDLPKAPSAALQRTKLVTALGEACTFAPGLEDAMRLIPSAAAADALRLESKSASQEVAAWTSACPGGKSALDTALATSGAARRDALWVPCDLQRFKYVTADELAKANGHVILSVLVAKHFQEQRVPEFTALPLLRALAGVAGTAAPPAAGPGDVWATARDAAATTATVKWNAMTEAEWGERAGQMVGWCDAVRERPAVERQKNRKVEFDVCAQAGRAAENANLVQAPLFRSVGGAQVNFGYYAAASAAFGDRPLLDHASDEALKNSVAFYVGQLESKALPIAP